MRSALAPRTRNPILSQLSDADFRLLEPDLEAVDLPLRKVLERRGLIARRRGSIVILDRNALERMSGGMYL
jgi:hypothetical protein